MGFTEELTKFIFVEDKPESSDIIFIPGSEEGAIALTAARLYRQGYAPILLPSGRYSKPVGVCQIPGYESRTEWDFLRNILLREGVPEEAILEEKEATFTYENALYSRRVTDSLGLIIRKAILCPQAWHARRALLYYQVCYPQTAFLVCPTVTKDISRDNWFLADEKIDLVLRELEKCGSQFHEILKDERRKRREYER